MTNTCSYSSNHYILKITSLTDKELGFHGSYFAADGNKTIVSPLSGTTPYILNARNEIFGCVINLNLNETIDTKFKLEISLKGNDSPLVSGSGRLVTTHVDGKENYIFRVE